MIELLLAAYLGAPCNPDVATSRRIDRTAAAASFIEAYNAGDGRAAEALMVSNAILQGSDGTFTITGGAIFHLIDTAELGDYRIISNVQSGERVSITAEVDESEHLLVFEFEGRCIRAVTFYI